MSPISISPPSANNLHALSKKSKILDETFLTPKIRKRVHALMKADGYPELSKMMNDMENMPNMINHTILMI